MARGWHRHGVLLGAMLALALAVGGGCASVRPWERGRLAHDCMQLPVDAADMAYYGHLAAVREGSVGGATAGGGGCGCN